MIEDGHAKRINEIHGRLKDEIFDRDGKVRDKAVARQMANMEGVLRDRREDQAIVDERMREVAIQAHSAEWGVEISLKDLPDDVLAAFKDHIQKHSGGAGYLDDPSRVEIRRDATFSGDGVSYSMKYNFRPSGSNTKPGQLYYDVVSFREQKAGPKRGYFGRGTIDP